jgi:hypothetical protein
MRPASTNWFGASLATRRVASPAVLRVGGSCSLGTPSGAPPVTQTTHRGDPPLSVATTVPGQATILFLAASPEDEPKLALDRDAREIRGKIRVSDHRDTLLFRTGWAARPDGLLQHLNEYRLQAVHFSGHGGNSGAQFWGQGATLETVYLFRWHFWGTVHLLHALRQTQLSKLSPEARFAETPAWDASGDR